MTYAQSLANEVRLSLAARGLVEEKIMFGGLAFMLNGKLCTIVNDRPDHIMLVRIGPHHPEALERKGASVAVMRGHRMPGWVYLQKEAIKAQDDFDYWIDLAISFNNILKSK